MLSILLVLCVAVGTVGTAQAVDIPRDASGNVVVPLSAELQAMLDTDVVSTVPRHFGSNDPLTEGFTESGPTPSVPAGDTGPNGDFWKVHHDPKAGGGGLFLPRHLQRYQGTASAIPAGVITVTAIGNIQKNVSRAISGDPAKANPLYHGNTMVLSLDVAANGPTVTGAWGNELDRIFEGNSDPGNPAREYMVDATKTHIYQWVGDPGGTYEVDLYVDGVLAIDNINPAERRTGLDNHVGWLWGSVTRSAPVLSGDMKVDRDTCGAPHGPPSQAGCERSNDPAVIAAMGQADSSAEYDGDIVRTLDIEAISNWHLIQVQSGSHIVPEPTTAMLLTAVVPLLLRRRR